MVDNDKFSNPSLMSKDKHLFFFKHKLRFLLIASLRNFLIEVCYPVSDHAVLTERILAARS
jgi:hypothetical protein